MLLRSQTSFLVTAVISAALLAGWQASAQDIKDKPTPPAGQPELPPGWTAEDMQAYALAGTPGKMHEHLAKAVGTWVGKTQMWMGPDAKEPMQGECQQTVTMVMDGRYQQGEMTGEMPGMGPFKGFGVTGYDNVSQKFVGSWIDNHSTGIMQGVGELSADGKTLNWTFSYNCPITKKPVSMRQIETYPDDKTMTFEMFTTDPKSGKEYKCMRIEFTKKA
jgi:hypothetical protein